MQVAARLKHTWSSQLSQSSPGGSLLLTRFLGIIQPLKLSSTSQAAHRGYWQLQHEKKILWEARESKPSPNSQRSTHVPSSIICFAYELHSSWMPPTASTGSSRAKTTYSQSNFTPSAYLRSRSHHATGQGEQEPTCRTRAAQG